MSQALSRPVQAPIREDKLNYKFPSQDFNFLFRVAGMILEALEVELERVYTFVILLY